MRRDALTELHTMGGVIYDRKAIYETVCNLAQSQYHTRTHKKDSTHKQRAAIIAY